MWLHLAAAVVDLGFTEAVEPAVHSNAAQFVTAFRAEFRFEEAQWVGVELIAAGGAGGAAVLSAARFKLSKLMGRRGQLTEALVGGCPGKLAITAEVVSASKDLVRLRLIESRAGGPTPTTDGAHVVRGLRARRTYTHSYKHKHIHMSATHKSVFMCQQFFRSCTLAADLRHIAPCRCCARGWRRAANARVRDALRWAARGAPHRGPVQR